MECFSRAAASDLPTVHDAPHLLLLLSDGSLLAYKAVSPRPGAVAFARLPLPLLSYAGKAPPSKAPASACMTRFDGLGDNAGLFYRRVLGACGSSLLVSAAELVSPDERAWPATCSGIFVCGAAPMWLVAARGTLAPVPMDAEGPVAGMTPFHNVNCPHVSSH